MGWQSKEVVEQRTQQRTGWEKGHTPSQGPELHTPRGPHSYGARPGSAVCDHAQFWAPTAAAAFFLTPSQHHHLTDSFLFMFIYF